MIRTQSLVAGLSFALMAGLGSLAAVFSLRDPVFSGMFLVHGAGHTAWIVMDSLRRDRGDVDTWGLFAFWFGPFVLCAYLIREYRERAAAFIPLYLGLETTALFSYPITLTLLRGHV
jgi:hypothetical protein